MPREVLGNFEYEILSTLIQEPCDAYGAIIQKRIEEKTNRSISVGALYTTLDRLEKKGMVSSWWGEPTAERGGRRKRYYKIDACGVEAVRRSESTFRRFGALAPVGG